MEPERPRVVCSVRDILVGRRDDQARHDERVVGLANRYFDAILVHSDPQFARLDDTFRPATPLRGPCPLHGLRHQQRRAGSGPARRTSAARAGVRRRRHGGRAAVPRRCRRSSTLASQAGPHHHRAGWSVRARARVDVAADSGGATRRVRSGALPARPSRRDGTIGGHRQPVRIQHDDGHPARSCACGRRAVFAKAARTSSSSAPSGWQRLGVLRSIPLDGLDAQRLAESVIEAAASSPARVSLDLDGRDTSARIVAELCSAYAAGVGV